MPILHCATRPVNVVFIYDSCSAGAELLLCSSTPLLPKPSLLALLVTNNRGLDSVCQSLDMLTSSFKLLLLLFCARQTMNRTYSWHTCDQWLLSFCLRSVSRSSLSWSHSFMSPWACSTLPSIPAASASLTRLFTLLESSAICSWLRCVCCGDNDDGYNKNQTQIHIQVG